MSKRSFLLLIGFFFLVWTAAFPQGKKTEIIILHVNDMHSKIDNMARLAWLADSLRKDHPWVFLVSAGDNFTGNPVVDAVPDRGRPMIDLMNRCGFSASAIGNHEFDMGQTLLKQRIAQARFPFICCNADGTDAVVGQFRPYTLLHAGNDVSIALLGLLQLDDNGLPSAHPSNLKDIKFVDGISKAKDYAELKDRYGILIALSHLGLAEDIRLADSMPRFDAIIGGHSHTVLNQPRFANGVMIVQAGSNLKFVGKIILTVENGKVVSRSDTLILLSSIKHEDRGVRALIDMFNENPEFNKIVGTASKTLEGEDQLGSLMTDALTSQLQVDFAFQNRGGIRLNSLPAGAITLKEVYQLDPFNNQVVIFTMKADEISSLICYGFRHEKQIDLQVSGMTYSLTDDGQGQCGKVEMLDAAGKPLDPAREYSVAINDYMASTYKFDHKDPGTYSTLTTSEALIRYLRTKKNVDYSGVKRATLIK